MQGNKKESEPFLYLTLLVGERERAANSGLPSKQRARGKEEQTKSGISLGANCPLRNKKKKNSSFPPKGREAGETLP